jgi:nucleoside 2-deoxyribosyltransferase
MKVYVASPLGFSECGRYYYKKVLLPRLRKCGCKIIDPWTLTDEKKIDAVVAMPYGPKKRDAWRRLNVEIGRNNENGIKRSDLVFAVLDGVDVDSGTASEIGCGFALGKVILGYRGDFRLSADNEGSTVNLQVEYFIRASGGDIITSIEQIPEAIRKIQSRTKT